jgi:hypothetical protein
MLKYILLSPFFFLTLYFIHQFKQFKSSPDFLEKVHGFLLYVAPAFGAVVLILIVIYLFLNSVFFRIFMIFVAGFVVTIQTQVEGKKPFSFLPRAINALLSIPWAVYVGCKAVHLIWDDIRRGWQS